MTLIIIIVLLVLIALNGIFNVTEIAFVAANENKLKEMSYKSKHVKKILEYRKEPDKFLSLVQVGITVTGVVSGIVSGVGLAEDLSKVLISIPYIGQFAYQISLVLLVIFITYFTIVFGELIPKVFAFQNPESLILKLEGFITVTSVLLHPFIQILSLSVRVFYKIAGIKTTEEDENALIKQISGITKIALIENKIEKEQERIIRNTIKINKIKIKDIMVKKENIKYLYSDLSFSNALIEAHLHQHTRYLVFDKNKNETVGYLNFKDIINMLKFNPENPSLLSVTRPVLRFNEQEYVIGALKKMTKHFQHIALIVDAQNDEAGLITMEDIIETIVGDIRDEYDFIPDHLYKIAHNRFIAGGRIKLEKLHESVSKSFPETTDFFGDWLMDKFPGAIKTDSRVDVGDLGFIIKKINRSRIAEVIIEIKE
jgi:putative hemolysin